MANFISANTPDAPDYLAVARGLYGEAFGSGSRPDLEEAVAEWSALTKAEQGFATAHLLYLSIEAQAATRALLEDVRDALEDLQINAEQATGLAPPPPAPEPTLEVLPDADEVLVLDEEDDDITEEVLLDDSA